MDENMIWVPFVDWWGFKRHWIDCLRVDYIIGEFMKGLMYIECLREDYVWWIWVWMIWNEWEEDVCDVRRDIGMKELLDSCVLAMI